MPPARDYSNYRDHLDVVTGPAGDRPKWKDIRVMLIRSDGYLG